jgi:hypothetical protein
MFNTSPPLIGSTLFTALRDQYFPLPTLPWPRIIELRSNRLATSFRSKIADLQTILNTDDACSAHDLLTEIERSDLRELARLVKPSPRRSLLTAVASNLPLPLPVNPVSLAAAVTDVQRQQELERRFGWLFFALSIGNDDNAA